MKSDWHFSVAEVDGKLQIHSYVRDQRAADFVIEQLERLKEVLRKPPRNPIIPDVWKVNRTFK